MSQSQSLSGSPSKSKPAAAFKPARYFYTAAAMLMIALAFIGFNKFYFHGRAYPDREITPPIRTVVIIHGSAMMCWLALLLIQPALIVRGSRKMHMTIGRIGVVLSAVVLILGMWIAVGSARATPSTEVIWGLSPKQFMAIPFISAWIFAGFVAVGIFYRRKPQIHRPMMFLATLSAIAAAVSRIDPLNNLYLGTVWERLLGPFFGALVIGVVLLGIRCMLTRSFDRWFGTGLCVLTVLCALIMQIAPTAAWDRFASIFVH